MCRMLFGFLVCCNLYWLSLGFGVEPQAKQKRQLRTGPQLVDSLGDPLPPGAIGRLGTIRFRQGDYISNLAYSPDGKQIASVSSHSPPIAQSDGTRLQTFRLNDIVRDWDAVTGKLIGEGPPNFPFAIEPDTAFSPDGKIMAAPAEEYGTIRLSEVKADKTLHVLKSHDGRIDTVTFSQDGKMLASASRAFAGWGRRGLRLQFIIWDTITGKKLRELADTDQRDNEIRGFTSLAFSPDKQLLATSSRDGTVRLFDVNTGKELHRFAEDGRVRMVRFSPDGKTLAYINWCEAFLADVATRRIIKKLTGQCCMDALAFSPDGKTLAVAERSVIQLWEVATGQQRTDTAGHQGAVIAIAFSPRGKLLASASEDGTVRLWDYHHQELKRIEGIKDCRFLIFSPDGSVLVQSSREETCFYNVATAQFRSWPGENRPTGGQLAYSPDGRLLVSVIPNYDVEATIDIWNANSGAHLHTLRGSTFGCCVTLSPDGQMLVAAGGRDSLVRFWDTATGKEIKRIGGEDLKEVNQLAFSPDGKSLALAAGDSIRLWDIATGKEMWKAECRNYGLHSVVFGTSGDYLLASGSGNVVWVLATKTGKELAKINDHGIATYDYVSLFHDTVVAVAPDGRTFATGGEHTAILLWDIKRLLTK
jgi:WD40 repeat protein